MCGICGFNWDDKKLVRDMSKVISHRGPDQNGTYTDKEVSLGHQRLSIIDLSTKGKQPMSDSSGSLTIVYNGEIYNHLSIREDLEKKGHRFRSETDTEMILYAYKEYGKECVKKFNGMFAFALWDSEKKQLFLARDRMGIKPLYYYFRDGKFIFASEIKAILKHEIERSVDKNSFHTFMNFRFVTGQKTMFKNILKLLPGHTLSLDIEGIKIKKYWDVSEKIEKKPLSYFSKKLNKMLEKSVEKRLMSDVPLGVYLSGGIDSSTIVALMRNIGGKDCNINTFSVGFGNEVDNEYSYAREVSNHFATNHHEVSVDDDHLKIIPDMIYHLEEPIGDAATLPTYAISKFAKKGATVVLAGEGADEQFAGYDRYKMALYGNKISKVTPSVLKNQVSKHIKLSTPNYSRLKNLICEREPGNKYMHAISLFTSQEIKKLDVSKSKDIDIFVKKHFVNSNPKHFLNKLLYFDQKTLLPDDFFMKVDKMTMAHSIEERVPFLDHNIVEFSFTIPTRYKMKGLNEKFILKKAMSGLLPKSVLKRPKRGYNAPMDKWLSTDLKSPFSNLLDENNHNLYDKQKITKMLSKFKHSRSSYKSNWFNSQKLWSLFVFEMWHKRFILNEKN
jgi:asparagine synthase (glutamine-hydrolysing)